MKYNKFNKATFLAQILSLATTLFLIMKAGWQNFPADIYQCIILIFLLSGTERLFKALISLFWPNPIDDGSKKQSENKKIVEDIFKSR
ncbi:hypothetical protein RF679_03875 [Undibacterium cyanobacteriorum]|uniref:Gliding motility protein GldL n=1 Tax=Undibacterium cyanobacteriorum TaxID=3073561 RepID=A0ABY9RJK9_9BURK|nr:hypothetical protein [Undibacterium sp. 20NA77.5]WMW81426.1 hypothetical protein RF679_03875 [Undibacterium sp. 20NA77.5]